MDGRFTHATILPPGQKIDPQDYLALLSDPGCGSIVTFSAVVREIDPGTTITGLDYEQHPDMALPELRRVLDAALEKFDVRGIVCAHRSGFVAVGETAVLILVASEASQDGFAACEYVLGEMKSTVPIWKTVAGLTQSNQ